MKFLKGFVIVLFVLLVLVFGGAYVFLKFFDINKYRPQIAAEISRQIGRKVTIDRLTLKLSLLNGVYGQLAGLRVSEDPGFGQGDFASIGVVELGVDVLAYLTRREIVVTKVLLEALNVTIIGDQTGSMNIQTIASLQNQSTVSLSSSENLGSKSNPAVGIPDFSVKTISLKNAAVLFVDKGQNPPMQLAISNIQLSVKDFSLNRPFDFEGQLAVLGAETNMTIAGQAAVNLATQEVKLSRFRTQLDLAKLKVVDLIKVLPQLAQAGSTYDLSGTMMLQISSLSGQGYAQPQKFLNSLKATGQFQMQDGKIGNINLLKTIFDRMEVIPGLSTMIQTNIPEQYRADYQDSKTVFEKIASNFQIENAVVNLPDLEIVSRLFVAQMQIKFDTQLNGKISGQITLPLDLSEYLFSQAKALGYLKNRQGNIVIALSSFEGPLRSLKIIPDVKALGKAVLENEGRNQIQKLFNKALKVDDSANPSGEGSSQAPQKELINGVLDGIFQQK